MQKLSPFKIVWLIACNVVCISGFILALYPLEGMLNKAYWANLDFISAFAPIALFTILGVIWKYAYYPLLKKDIESFKEHRKAIGNH